jgi:predicted dehydrogenase
LDILDFIFGPISEACGYSKNQAALYEAEDITVGSFHFESGIMGQGVWCFNCSVPSDEEITTIVGSQGEIRFSHFGDHSVLLKQQDRETQHFKFEISKNIQQALIQTIVDELRGKGRCPSTGASAARTARVMDQIYKRIDT